MKLPFNKPFIAGNEMKYIEQATEHGQLAAEGKFTKDCQAWLEDRIGCRKALLTNSCTSALEIAALLLEAKPGDEVIMPSYTSVATASAFALRGLVPVFTDIRKDTLNIDESLVEAAITPKCRAIVPVHYAGVGAEMEIITDIAKRHGLMVIEDNAQGILSSYKGKPLGSFGQLATLSFHETKNITSGLGGCLLLNDDVLINRAEVIRDKGTNRNSFLRGEIENYSWIDLGSSYLCGELTSAFLYAQLEQAERIQTERLSIWNAYHSGLEALESKGQIRRPRVPQHCLANGHIYYLVLNSAAERKKFIRFMACANINVVFHYVPLHSSPAGKKYGRTYGQMLNTDRIASVLVRLPVWVGLDTQPVIDAVYEFFGLGR